MELTRQADYAIRCVLEVARHERLAAAEIATRQGLSPSFVGKIVGSLARAGILETRRGASGGVSLGRPPQDISILEVVEAVQGPIRLNRCVRVPPACSLVETCPVSPVVRQAQQALADAFSVTFDAILDQDQRRRSPLTAAETTAARTSDDSSVRDGHPVAVAGGVDGSSGASGRP